MSEYHWWRRWAGWSRHLALLAASGCAASGSSGRVAGPDLTPSASAVARDVTAHAKPPRGSLAARPARTGVPRRSNVPVTKYASRTHGNELELQRAVVKFTRQPSDLISPPVPVRRWQFIVLHHSGEANGGYESIDRFHRGPERGWDECGYHFVIGNGSESGDGEIEVGSRWLKQKHGAHTHPPGHTEYNEHGLGICLIGDCNQAPPTPRQIEACQRLIAYLQNRCDVSDSGVMTHGDAEGANTDCPGRYFPYDRLVPRSGFASR